MMPSVIMGGEAILCNEIHPPNESLYDSGVKRISMDDVIGGPGQVISFMIPFMFSLIFHPSIFYLLTILLQYTFPK